MHIIVDQYIVQLGDHLKGLLKENGEQEFWQSRTNCKQVLPIITNNNSYMEVCKMVFQMM